MVADPQLARAQTWIARPALEGRINVALDEGSLLLIADAGYGKTLALDAALRSRGTRCAWVHCDEAYGDAGRLLRRLVSAVDEAAPGTVRVLSERLESAAERVDVRVGVADFLEELDRHLVEPLVLVVDDAEHLQAVPGAARLLNDLLAARIDRLSVAAATRQRLPLRLAKLRSAGLLTELGPRDLAFTPEECGQLLVASGRSQEARDEERLFATTDGWPLGAALAAVYGDSPAAHGSASRSELFSYLREEVLEPLPDALRRKALTAATLRELDAGCMRALGLPEQLPEELGERGLALQPAGSEREWFAFHPLVREFLRCCRDQEFDRPSLLQLHREVAPALEAAGRREEAIEHWLEGRAWEEATAAIAEVAPGLIHTAPGTARRWLEALPEEAQEAPACLLLRGLLAWEDGRNKAAVDLFRSAITRFAGADDVSGEWLARYALIDPLELTGEWEEATSLAEGFDDEAALAAGLVPPAVAAYAAAAHGALGRMAECAALSQRILAHPHVGPLRSVRPIWECDRLIMEGKLERAVAGAEEAVKEAERSDPFNRLATFAFFHAALVTQQGRDADALALFERAEEIAQGRHLHYLAETSRAWRALLHARNGRPDAAEQELARVGRKPGTSWRDAATETARARLAALRGDAEEVGRAAERARSLASRAVLFERFQAAIELPPALLEAGLLPAARDVIEEHLGLLDTLQHEAGGNYFRALLLAVRASLADADGRAADTAADLRGMWEATADQAGDVVRREWRILEPLLWKALENGTLEPEPVLRSIGEAFPGGEAILPFTAHQRADARRVAVTAAANSGHPELPVRLSKLARDPDREVAAAAGAAGRRLRATPPPLVFKVLGDFSVRRGCWRVEDRAWDRRVAQRVVRYLLVSRGRAVPDDLLLEAFWPGVAEGSARQRLNVAVSCARAALDVPGADSVIEATEHTLQLRLRDRDSVDSDRFEHAAGTALAADGTHSRNLLERAASMWGGEPLPQERYADWAIAWRENLTDLYAQVLARLAQGLHAEEDAPAATLAAKKLVQLDPLNEQANMLLMASYARSGRRGHALRQYLACRRALLDELGVEPAEETTELQRRILAGERV